MCNITSLLLSNNNKDLLLHLYVLFVIFYFLL